MNNKTPTYQGYRFPPDIISYAVWLYHRFCLSFRDVEDLLAERGIIVSYETIRQWCQKFGAEYARTLKRRQGRLGDTCLVLRKNSFFHRCCPHAAIFSSPYS
jgi:putative transposase